MALSFDQVSRDIKDNKFASSYVEAVAVDHCKRWAPTYYIKGDKGEVDIAVIQGTRIYPVEVKWVKNILPEDIKEIQRYPRGIVLNQGMEQGMVKNIYLVPLVRFLVHIGARQLVV